MKPRRLKLRTHVDSGWMYGVYQNQAAAAYSSLYFLFFQYLSIKIFFTLFSGTVRTRRLKLGTHVDSGWIRATENRFFAGSDRFLVCKTNSVCIKRIFFRPKKTHFADHILAQFPGLVKCQTVNCHNYSNYQCCQDISY